MSIVVYDVETRHWDREVKGGFDNPEAMGFGCAVLYNYQRDAYEFFTALRRMRDYFAVRTVQLAVSFNGLKFDNRVIWGNDLRYCANQVVPQFDILQEVVRRRFGVGSVAEAEAVVGEEKIHGNGWFSLDNISRETLGRAKTGHGKDAPHLIRNHKWAQVLAYNLHDVRLTQALFEHIVVCGYLVAGDGERVDFDPPADWVLNAVNRTRSFKCERQQMAHDRLHLGG